MRDRATRRARHGRTLAAEDGQRWLRVHGGQIVRTLDGLDDAGARAALGDVNRDGTADIIAAAGPGGGPHVKIFDGATGALIREFFAYDSSFHGGVTVAAADVNEPLVALNV